MGFGTWSHVEAFGAVAKPRHIEIEWFGVHSDYQGKSDEDGEGVADSIYASIEQVALAHPDSKDDMPFTLACHVDNERGQRFWKRQGYRLVPEPGLKVEDEIYYRMVR